MEIRSFPAEELGNSSHLLLIPEAGLAVAVDPFRDVAPYLEAVEAAGLRLAWALETHVHNDFVSGARELQGDLRLGFAIEGANATHLLMVRDPRKV